MSHLPESVARNGVSFGPVHRSYWGWLGFSPQAAIMPTYLTHDDIRLHIGLELMLQVFDDQQDGDWRRRVDMFIVHAESEFEQNYAKIYGEDTLTAFRALATTVSDGAKRIMLDLFTIRMGWRHPEYTNSQLWEQRRTRILEDLRQLRLREVQLDRVTEPEAQCEGGTVESGDPDDTEPVASIFYDMGIF